MKWPTKKPSSSSTSHGFPTSWITKFKLKREIPTKTKEKQQGSRFVYREYARDCQGIMDEAAAAAADEKHKGQKPKKPMLVRNEIDQMRKSVYIGRGSSKDQDRPSKQQQQQRKSTCKIKAIENLKKANKKKPSKSVTEGGMESFAVVKHSQDPQRDFRDSMMDMIMEKGIKDPDHMEKLLACYLRLNDDEYHDLIIKAFRQVWCEFDHIRALNHQLLELNLVSDN